MNFEKITETMTRLAAATSAVKKNASAFSSAPAAGGGAAGKLDPDAVGHALAEFMRGDNAVAQQIAILSNNLATKYSDKAA